MEASELFQSNFPAFGPHDFVQMGFSPRLQSFWQIIKYISDFVDPAALFLCVRIDVAQSGSIAESAIGDSQLGLRHAPAFEITEKRFPGLG